MSIAFLPLCEVDPAGARELLVRHFWKRDWSEELAKSYFSWRYGARNNGEALVAVHKGRCVAILDSFIRPYWIDGRRELVRETCDWFCLPEYRTFGVGLHLMRRMMAKPEPILVIGGSDQTQDLLPRFKWAPLRTVDNFGLPVSARTVARLAAHKRWPRATKLARFVPDIRLRRQIRQLPPPSSDSHTRIRMLGEAEELQNVAPYAVAPALDTNVLDWFASAPPVIGRFLQLSFFSKGQLVGFSISRLEELPDFGIVSRIVHVQAARFDLIDWMVSATVQQLLEQDAGVVLCRASCPITGRALSALGFWRLKRIPVHWWSTSLRPPDGLLHLSALQADDALHFT